MRDHKKGLKSIYLWARVESLYDSIQSNQVGFLVYLFELIILILMVSKNKNSL